MSDSPVRVLAAATLAAAVTASLAAVVLTAAPATAAPTAHDPIGSVTSTTAGRTVTFSGWALDQDAPTSRATVLSLVDGYTKRATSTTLTNATVTSKYRANATPGFRVAITVADDGRAHTACVGIRNVGGGLPSVLRCTTVGKRQPPAVASHSPFGTVSAKRSGTLLRFTGRATDPDFRDRRLVVTLWVDGRRMAGTLTRKAGTGRPAGSGASSYYAVSTRVGGGRAHTACVRVDDVGPGATTTINCKRFDLKSHRRNGLSATEKRRLAGVAALAGKQFGKPYVWAAEGPKAFDCSGLVQWTYRKNKLGLTPRVAQDQFAAARIIPASKARAGDLVFYYDQRGYVHHVGIYLRPGMTIAAMSPRLGIGFQPVSMTPGIDGSGVSYGSFTHS